MIVILCCLNLFSSITYLPPWASRVCPGIFYHSFCYNIKSKNHEIGSHPVASCLVLFCLAMCKDHKSAYQILQQGRCDPVVLMAFGLPEFQNSTASRYVRWMMCRDATPRPVRVSSQRPYNSGWWNTVWFLLTKNARNIMKYQLNRSFCIFEVANHGRSNGRPRSRSSPLHQRCCQRWWGRGPPFSASWLGSCLSVCVCIYI